MGRYYDPTSSSPAFGVEGTSQEESPGRARQPLAARRELGVFSSPLILGISPRLRLK